jgi:AraC-like DNA-binding protein
MCTASFMHQRSPSLESFQATMSGLLRPCRISRQFNRHYTTEITHGQMRPFSLTILHIGGRVRIEVDPQEDMTLLQVPLKGNFVSRSRCGEHASYRCGHTAQLIDARAAMDLEFSRTTRMMIFKLREEQIDLLGGKSVIERHAPRSRSISLQTVAGRSFHRLCEIAAGEIGDGPNTIAEDLAASLEDRLLATLAIALNDEPHGTDNARIVPTHIRRAERFMMDNLSEPLNLDAIVQAAGTSARTLHRTFKQVRGDTPLNILKNMRLEKVHDELRRGYFGPGDVTRIAMNWGFNHMGLFAADYRSRYGMTPSAAARKLQG